MQKRLFVVHGKELAGVVSSNTQGGGCESMRICYIVNNNASVMRATLPARYLVRKKHEVSVIVVSPHEADIHIYGGRPDGLGIIRVDHGWMAPGRVRAALDEIAPEVVHAIGTGRATFWPALRYKQAHPDTILVTDIDELLSAVYPFPKNVFMKRWEQTALMRSDMVVVVSRELQDRFEQCHANARICYLPNAVDLETFDRYAKTSREIAQIADDRPVVIYMGFMLPRYRTERVIEVAQLVLQQNAEVQFVLIGKGPEKQKLETMVQNVGIADNVTFTGFIPDEEVPQYLSAANVLLLPIEDTSINRARCPNKVFLYCAAQIPIVTNAVGEVKHTLDEDALYFDFASNEDFAQKIMRALETGEPYPSRSKVEENSWAARVEHYLTELEKVKSSA